MALSNFQLVDIFNDELIETRVNNEYLDERLNEGIKNKKISGEQWFRNPQDWYSITAYANPYKTPFSELKILLKEQENLKPLLKNTLKIFYGVGIGETETVPVEWDLQDNKYSEVIGIDIIEFFHKRFYLRIKKFSSGIP